MSAVLGAGKNQINPSYTGVLALCKYLAISLHSHSGHSGTEEALLVNTDKKAL